MENRNIDMRCRIIIVELMKEGYATGSIKEIMKSRHGVEVSKRGIQKIIKKFKTSGLYEDKKRSGRPPKLSKRSERIIRRTCLKNRTMSLNNITKCFNIQHSPIVSRHTVNRILVKYGLRSHRAVRKPFLNQKQRKRRMEWARYKRHWDAARWAHVVFSDESIFHAFSQNSSHQIRRFDKERFSPLTTKKVQAHKSKVHVWGCFSRFGVGILKRIRGNINSKVYQDLLVNDIDLICKCLVFPLQHFIFQHDNAPAHRSVSTLSFLTERNINILEWPANSPDANPIENLWHLIKSKINTLGPLTSEQMWTEIQNAWYNIPGHVCRALVDSMPRRVTAMLKMKGYPTKY